MFENYEKVCRGGDPITLEIEGIGEVEGKWHDAVRIDPSTMPNGKHGYQTRHTDTDWSAPASIVGECADVRVNFCGTFVTDKALPIEEETDVLDYCFG